MQDEDDLEMNYFHYMKFKKKFPMTHLITIYVLKVLMVMKLKKKTQLSITIIQQNSTLM